MLLEMIIHGLGDDKFKLFCFCVVFGRIEMLLIETLVFYVKNIELLHKLF